MKLYDSLFIILLNIYSNNGEFFEKLTMIFILNLKRKQASSDNVCTLKVTFEKDFE